MSEDEQKETHDDAAEDLELDAEAASEVTGGTDPQPAPVLHRGWPQK